MPIVYKSKLKRLEIIERFENRQNFHQQVNKAFFKSVDYTENDYMPFWKKVVHSG